MVKRTGCGIEKPSDLNGKRIGLDTLQNSAGLWMRAFCKTITASISIDRVVVSGGRRYPFEPAQWMNVKRVAQGKNIDQMLVDGELEARCTRKPCRPSEMDRRKSLCCLRTRKSGNRVLQKRRPLSDHAHGGDQNEILDKHPWPRSAWSGRLSMPRSFATNA